VISTSFLPLDKRNARVLIVFDERKRAAGDPVEKSAAVHGARLKEGTGLIPLATA
jgi:hypothetical protein